MITYEWRGHLQDDELNRLHAEGFDHRILDIPWMAQLERHSLGWVIARDGDDLVGFVNVAWDGGVHAFVLDTLVARSHRRRGIGSRLVAAAGDGARDAGCEWLHADYDEHLVGFYEQACGMTRTPAGLIEL